MIIIIVEFFEFRIGQVRDDGRVTPGVQTIGLVWEERTARFVPQQVIGRGIISLHFVKDHPLVTKRCIGVFDLVVPAFLLQGVFWDKRVEHGVEIDVDQVVEILQVLAGNWIAGLVGVGEGIQEGVERAFGQFNERLFDRIFARAAQDGMFHDVSDAVGRFGRRAERDAKDFVLVRVGNGHQACTGFIVHE